MLVITKAIILSKLRYKDHDLIVKCYTSHFGIISYLVKGVLKTKKGKLKPAYFQMGSILNFHADHKQSRNLQYIKDIKLQYQYKTIQQDIIKTSVALFITEIITNTLKEEEKNTALYAFLENTLIWLDNNKINASFHILFLIELTKHLGIYPNIKHIEHPFFNLKDAVFETVEKKPYTISGESLTFFKQLLGTNFDTTKAIAIKSNQKHEILDMILLYFKLHLDGFKHPKSVLVLNQVFA